ncbi:hypothetical protein SASPL_120643 [Salvia splendens]|uniref:Retroviral polymerase SH3-like domain-containing protein n=1 Tax=Salvia splendens TaxID=180675 RepID=A0A8X8ZWF7_SALSN|nr:hypothetical protein SASPL_120643 [Salvia splendens]
MLTSEALQKAIPKGVKFESSETIGVNPCRRVWTNQAKLPRSVWGMTPQEAWSRRKPGIAHLRVFGSKAYAHVPDQTRSKLDDKSKPFIFIGYDSNTKGYKLYDPTSQKTMISRDVEIDKYLVDNGFTKCPHEHALYVKTIVIGAGDNDDRKSTSGYVFYMGDTAFTWMSKKQPIVTLSTCEAEYVAATFSVCHAVWLRSLLAELGWSQKEPTTIFVDNKSAIALSKNPVFHNRSKHIDIRFHYIRECVANQEIQVKYVKSQDQVADIFTKPLKFEDFIKIRMLLGMTNQV